jgi:hypothetical protein
MKCLNVQLTFKKQPPSQKQIDAGLKLLITSQFPGAAFYEIITLKNVRNLFL